MAMTLLSSTLPCGLSRPASTRVQGPTSRAATAPPCGCIGRLRLSKGTRNKVQRSVVLAVHLADVPQARYEAATASGGAATSAKPGPAPEDIVIVSACRTALTKATKGGFKDTPPDALLTAVLKDTLRRTGVKPEEVEDICIGSCLAPSSKRANECRIAAFLAGFPPSVPVCTVNRQCASGLQSIADVAANIKSGYYSIGIAGGLEHMTTGAMAWEGSTNPKIEENKWAKDCLLPMGMTAENVADQFHVSREVEDKAAADSHAKAAAAQAAGKFKAEIVPVETVYVEPTSGVKKTVVVDQDDAIRPDFTYDKLSKLRPVFKKGGTVTIGNSCGVTDGAAAVMLMTRQEAERRGLPIMAVLRSYAAVGVEPAVMGIGPAKAVPKALEQAGLSKDDIDVYEINEAFGSQYAYCVQDLGLDESKVNPNGGAIALGHPIGCTGARQTVTLLHELARQGTDKPARGVVSMCTGSGMGAAAVFEQEPKKAAAA